MLTPQLVNATLRDGCVTPRFVVPTPGTLALCENLIRTYREALAGAISLREMEELLRPILNDARSRRLALGLRRLLEERCEHAASTQLDYPTKRRELLNAAAELLRGDDPLPPPGTPWAAVLQQRCPDNPLLTQEAVGGESCLLYGDLPEFDRIVKFDEPTPELLLERYNTALVQTLLLGAQCMTITVASENAQQLRRLCQYLRFFQLLADLREVPPDEQPGAFGNTCRVLRMRVDGPGAVLEQGRRYGVQLATFFPAVCTMPHWQLAAHLLWESQDCILKLDDSSGLRCPYHHFSAVLPDEVKLFQQRFAEGGKECEGWKIVENAPAFLKGPGKELIFPDFAFRRGRGRVVHLELFHRWHANGLPERLAWLEKHPRTPLVVAVDRSLAKRPEIAEILDNSTLFQKYGFLYREYPTLEKTVRALSIVGSV